jgi:hypothetical protein
MFFLLSACVASHPQNITLLFESYEGYWFVQETDSPGLNHRLRIYLDWNPANITSFQQIHGSFFYSTPPTSSILQGSFLTTGFYFAPHFLLIYSTAPLVQIQASLDKNLVLLNKSLPNITHAQLHGDLVTSLSTPDNPPIVSWLLHRNCTFVNATEKCILHGTQRWWNSTIFLKLQTYDYLAYQARWRSMVAICGLAVTLMLLIFHHEHVRWSDVSPVTLYACQAGDYATVILFYLRRDDFLVGSTDGFALVAFWAVMIPFHFLGVRFETSNRAFARDYSTFEPPWTVKLFLVLLLFSGFTSFPLVTFLVRFSYWIPQIAYAALANHRRSISSLYAIGMTTGQLIFAGSVVKYHPLFDGYSNWIMIPSIVWSALQIIVIALQNWCGGAFFVPKNARQPRFDWRAERPPEGTQCSVCLDEIGDGEPFLATPCHHIFHDRCLRRWADEHADCPVCRTVLPSITVDPGEP